MESSINAAQNTSERAVLWPALPYEEWRDTCQTLHMWTQIVGKVRLELSPFLNHWWHVTLYVTPRGLTTAAIPYHGAPLKSRLTSSSTISPFAQAREPLKRCR